MASRIPQIYVLAGVNGAGKSSVGGAAVRAAGAEYYNPDEAAKMVMGTNPRLTQTEANGIAWQNGNLRLCERFTEPSIRWHRVCRYYRRWETHWIGDNRSVASSARRYEERRHNDVPFDIQPLPGSTIDDLYRLYYESEYLPATVARDILDANDRSSLSEMPCFIEAMKTPMRQ